MDMIPESVFVYLWRLTQHLGPCLLSMPCTRQRCKLLESGTILILEWTSAPFWVLFWSPETRSPTMLLISCYTSQTIAHLSLLFLAWAACLRKIQLSAFYTLPLPIFSPIECAAARKRGSLNPQCTTFIS